MSSGTSADQDRSEDEIPPVAPRHKDGALICKRRMEDGGRCGKLLLTSTMELCCDNGHAVSLELVRDTLLTNPKADVATLSLFQVQDEATWRAILKRVTSREFAAKELGHRNNSFLYDPAVFPVLLAQADRLDPKAAADLRACWEINLNNVCRPVWEWIAGAGSEQNRLLRREKAISAWPYWDNPSLAGLLVKHTLLQQVAQDLRLPESEPEIDTFNEIIMAMEDSRRTALVFRSRGLEDRVEFDLRVDPDCVSQEFGRSRNERVVFRGQIALSFEPQSMVLSAIPRDDPKAIAWFHHHMKSVQPTLSEEVVFEPKASLFRCVLRDPPKIRASLPAYGLGYQVIRAFVETYGLRRRPDWG